MRICKVQACVCSSVVREVVNVVGVKAARKVEEKVKAEAEEVKTASAAGVEGEAEVPNVLMTDSKPPKTKLTTHIPSFHNTPSCSESVRVPKNVNRFALYSNLCKL